MTYLNWVQTREEYGARWLKIFYHNSNNKVFFASEKEALFVVSSQKFSFLKYLNKIQRYESTKYEFLLEYPEIEGKNRWTQTLSPLVASPGSDNGYNPINISWDGGNWRGLFIDKGATYLKGSYTEYWFYAICSFNKYNYNDTFPGPSVNGVKNYSVKEAYLWIRIKDSGNPFSRCSLNYKQQNVYFKHCIFIASLLTVC